MGAPERQLDHQSEPGLAGLAVKGVLWQGLSFAFGRAFTLAATVVLARLLTPADFGLVGLALVFIAFAETVTDLGVAQALVFFDRDARTEDGALVLCVASGVALAAAGLLAAPAVADFFGRRDVEPMFRVFSAALLVGSLRQVPLALLRKSLDFRRVLVTDVARTVTQGVVSIVLAATGAGAWAIVWGYVAGSATWTASAWLVAGYRPHPDFVRRFSRPVAKRLLAYGAPAAAQGLLAALIFDVDYLIVGRVLGAEALGAYALAFRLPQVVIISVLGILSSVAFPLFSRARGEPARLKRGYLASIRLQSAYGAAAAVLLLMVAPMAVDVVFGPKWHASIVPLQALALYAAARSLGFGAVDVYKGIGRPGLAAGVALVRLAVLVPALLLAADRGIDAVAWTQAALALAFAIGMQGAAARIIGLRLADFGAALRPAAALAAGTAAGAAAARWGLAGPEGVRFVAAVAAGACGGLAALWVVDVQFLRDTRALLARGRSRSEVVAT